MKRTRTRYVRWENSEGWLGEGHAYMEVIGTTVMRQIEVAPKRYLTSSHIDPEFGAPLSDQPCDVDAEFDKADACFQITEVAQHEFDALWSAAMAEKSEEWSLLKAEYPVGRVFDATPQWFHPQGAVIPLNGVFYALLDYDEYVKAWHADNRGDAVSPGLVMKLRVTAHSDKNQCVLVGCNKC